MKDLDRPQICPHCAGPINKTVDPNTRKTPKPGDYAVCVHCLRVLRFDNEMFLKKLHPDEEYRVQSLYGHQIDEMRAKAAMANRARN